jgi:hypothetical protein
MRYVVVTGLPGSGKSTLARRLAPALNRPHLDKDDILEALFDSLGIGDAQWRFRLSRASDSILRKLAMHAPGAILTSWWQHPQSGSASGTPTGWFSSLPFEVVEIYCVCSPEIAATRFVERRRHAGHLDDAKKVSDLALQFEEYAALGPLGLGAVVEANTEHTVDLDMLLPRIKMQLERT